MHQVKYWKQKPYTRSEITGWAITEGCNVIVAAWSSHQDSESSRP